MNSPHKGQWRGALMFPLICAWINGWVNNRDAGDLRWYRAHYDVIVMPERPECWQGGYFRTLYPPDSHLNLTSHEIPFIYNLLRSSDAVYEILHKARQNHRGALNKFSCSGWTSFRKIWILEVFRTTDILYCNCTYPTMMTSSNGNIFRVTGHLCGEFTGPRWIPRKKASDAELSCFF